MADKPLSYYVVAIIDFVKKSKEKTLSHDKTQETLSDIHTLLCRLLSSMLTSPLTGRMFISTNADSQCEANAASLHRQLE